MILDTFRSLSVIQLNSIYLNNTALELNRSPTTNHFPFLSSTQTFQYSNPMDSTSNENDQVIHDFPPYFRVHKSGRFSRFNHTPQFSPTSDDPQSPVRSKDVVISPQSAVSARLYLPQTTTNKLPLLINIHGGAFCLGSPTNPTFHNYLTSLVSKSTVIAISIDYRLAPEHPLPTAYEDSWTALQWIASHAAGSGPDPWLNDHANFERVYLSGESAGANIANDVVLRAGVEELVHGFKIWGLVLIQPYFGGKEVDRMYKFMCPTSSGSDDDPRLNPAVDPRLERIGCSRVLVVVAEKDWLRERGKGYYELLKKKGLGGKVEMMEVEGVGHGFHLLDPTCEKALTQLEWVASFLKKE